MAKIRREVGSPLDEDAQLLLMARRMLGGPTDVGRASYQVALTVCEACGRGWQQGRGEQVEVGSEIVEMAGCDAQQLGSIARARACTNDNIVDQAGADTHVGAGLGNRSTSRAERAQRAQQDIPPAVRREVMRRDGGRCVVPGCRHAVFLDLHHLVLRSDGGEHDPDTLVVICGAHHRAQHRGQLIIEGRISTGLVFRHADGAQYGSIVSPRTAATHAEAFRALRTLGFRESEVRRALDRVRIDAHMGEASTETVLRQALALLAVGSRPCALAPEAKRRASPCSRVTGSGAR